MKVLFQFQVNKIMYEIFYDNFGSLKIVFDIF